MLWGYLSHTTLMKPVSTLSMEMRFWNLQLTASGQLETPCLPIRGLQRLLMLLGGTVTEKRGLVKLGKPEISRFRPKNKTPCMMVLSIKKQSCQIVTTANLLVNVKSEPLHDHPRPPAPPDALGGC